MKKLHKAFLAIFALGILLTGCESEKPKTEKNENSVVLKTEEQIDDEIETDAYQSLVKDANKDLSEEEISFLADLIKYIDAGDARSLANILADPIKSEVGGDLRVLLRKLSPLNYSGQITKIEKISKEEDKFTIVCTCEEDKLIIEASEKDNKLTSLRLHLGSTIANNKKLKEDNQAFIDKSYHIIDSLRDGNKNEFIKDVEALNQTPEKFDEMYEGLSGDLKLMGNILEDDAKVEVMYATDYLANAPVNENLVKVSLTYKFENIDKVIYNFVYREDLSIVSLEVTSGEE